MNHLENDLKQKPRIFLSYAIEDKAAASAIVEGLRLRNVNIWEIDRIQSGESWTKSIRNTIVAGDYLLHLLSKKSVKYFNMNGEIERILKELQTRYITFFPILLEDCEVPKVFAEYQYFNLRDGIDSSIEKLANSLKTTPDIDFDKLSTQAFEQLVFELLKKLGFVNIQILNNYDSKVDAIAEFYERDPFGIATPKVYAIETKFSRHSRAALRGIQQLTQYMASDPKIDKALLITNGNLTSVALDWVKDSQLPIRVIGGTELKRLLLQNTDLVDKYFTPSLSEVS